MKKYLLIPCNYFLTVLCITMMLCGRAYPQPKPGKTGPLVFYINSLDSAERPVRYFKELQLVATKYGIVAEEYIVLHDMEKQEDQQRREYYMDSLLSLKLGTDFRRKLIQEADSVFINKAAHTIVPYYACDTWPHARDMPEDFYKSDTDPYVIITLPDSLKQQLPPDEYGNLPHFFLCFIAGKNGALSGFKVLNNIFYSGPALSRKQQSVLLGLAKAAFISEAPWVPGTISGRAVRAEYCVDVGFN